MDGLENTSGGVETETFQARFCAQFHCPPTEYERRVLWKCVSPLAKPMARIVWLVWYGYFEPDLELIEEVRNASSYAGARNIVKCADGPATTNWLRRYFKIRMSRSRLLELVRTVVDRETPGRKPALPLPA